MLNYHRMTVKRESELPALDPELNGKISDKVERFFPIAQISQNKNAAYLEVVCDAALAVAEEYEINKRWFYTAVQGMTSMALVPNMYENAGDPVPLGRYHLLLYEDGDDWDSEAEDAAGNNARDDNEQGQEEESVPPPNSSPGGAAPKNNRLLWSESEIREVIDRRIAGESFPAIATRFGRTAFSIQNKWRKVSKPDSPWKDYIEQKKREVEGGLDGQNELSEEGDGSDGNNASDSSDETNENEEADEEVQPAASATDTGAVTGPPAVLEGARPWTDADIRELIKYKIDGLTNREINARVRRPNGSVHCQWVNLSMNTNGKWFKYIHKKYEEKRQREEQANAAQGDTGADAVATGQLNSSVSLSPSM